MTIGKRIFGGILFYGGLYLIWHFGNGYIALGVFLWDLNTMLVSSPEWMGKN